MIYYFWHIAFKMKDDDESTIGMPYDNKSVLGIVRKKINENLVKIQEQEADAFKMEKLVHEVTVDELKELLTCEMITEIQSKFNVSKTINYHIGGTYYCNSHNYVEYKCDLSFGFINIE